MRPVDKGRWPEDPNTNAPKVFKSDRKKKDDTYKKAKPDLICRLGPYCSYCETKLEARYLNVEHKLPKSLHPSLRGDWGNFLLACGSCNDAKSDKDIELDDVYWPEIDNTSSIFEYQYQEREDREKIVIIKVNSNLSEYQQDKAQRTLELTGLNRYPGGSDEPRPADERYEHRTEAWNKAHWCLKLLQKSDDEEMRKGIVDQAKDKGFFSVWMTVFQDDPDMLKLFIEAFPGTARKECFDEQGRPKPTISRSKSSTNVEPQPSYDSHISDDEPESLLEEEEETSTEPEAETPQPDAEFLPVDDSFRSEENSRSLFTRLIDAFSGNRQDYIGDRDELLSLEDSELESEDFLSEESAESESPDEPETETEAIDSEPESEDFLSEESAESESPDEPETETEAIDSEPESEDFLSEESAESESPDEPETETEAIDSETESEDSMETEAIDSEPEQPEATVNRQPQPT
ncbi:HNH endonuclease, partial [Planktothricoides sp. SR001]|uniref:HNH endonuclease n=1 Tax=Planktothricoides sp. SR001 TaxID=1705388 RepID=UPI0006C8E118